MEVKYLMPAKTAIEANIEISDQDIADLKVNLKRLERLKKFLIITF
jgi:hypothetical protein